MTRQDQHTPWVDTHEEKKRIREALAAAQPEDPCPEESVLGQYLDGGPQSPIEQRKHIEDHLSRCQDCQKQLIQLFREVTALSDPNCSISLTEENCEHKKVSGITNKSNTSPSQGYQDNSVDRRISHAAEDLDAPSAEKRK